MNPVIATISNLNPLEKKTFKLHLAYLFIEGIILGVLILNEFIFIKSLKGSAYQLSLLFQFSIVLLLLSVFLNEYLKRYRDKSKLLIIIGIITRLPLLGLLFFPGNSVAINASPVYHFIFLSIFFIYYIAQPIVMPITIQFLKTNYRHENFSKLYSYAAMLNRIIVLVITFLFGLLLDFDNFSFRYVYAGIGLLGIFSIVLLSRIKVESSPFEGIKNNMVKSIRISWKNFIVVMTKNKAFRDYEIGFMLYGYAWISTSILMNLFYDRVLFLNYSSTAFYKNIYNLVAIATLPTFGRLLHKTDLKKFSIVTYGFMLLMIVFTMLTQYFPAGTDYMGIKLFYFLLIASLAYGIFAGMMPLLWDIGSTYLCKPEETDTYMSIHMSLTGLRGLFSPLLGIWIFEQTGFTFTFGVAAVSLIVAMVYVYWSGKRRVSA